MVPVVQRLEQISGEIANTGYGILTRLQFLHRPLSQVVTTVVRTQCSVSVQTEIPGLVSSLTVSPPHCRALLHTPVYEKVGCSDLLIPCYTQPSSGSLQHSSSAGG